MAGSIFSWRFTLGGFGGCYTQWYRGTGRQKTTEGTGDHQNQQGTRDSPKRNKETAKMPGSPITKPGQEQKLGPGSPPTKAAASAPGRERTPSWEEGFPPPLGLNVYTYFKGRLPEKSRKRQIKKNTWEGFFFQMIPNCQILDLQA